MPQYEVLSCPFCNAGEVSCIHIPSSKTYRRKGRNSLGGGMSIRRSSEEWVVQSGCSRCGKTAEEIEKEFRRTGFIR